LCIFEEPSSPFFPASYWPDPSIDLLACKIQKICFSRNWIYCGWISNLLWLCSMVKPVHPMNRSLNLLLRGQLFPALMLLFFLGPAAAVSHSRSPVEWVPARWEGGPLEVSRHAKDKAVAENVLLRDVLANWYNPATLGLLEGSPINCLLVTFSAGPNSKTEREQHQLVKEYARLARARGIAVLGIVYPGANPREVAVTAEEAGLDGCVLDGLFPAEAKFAGELDAALRSRNSSAVVIPIARNAAPLRTEKAPLLAVEGVRPSARDLADMGIRAGPSAEPWLDSNIWLVRSFRLGSSWRPIWISQQPNASSQGDYARCVADAALAGGRWIVALDYDLRVRLFQKEAGALATWRNIGSYLKFAEDHAEWRSFVPYGNLAIITDDAGQSTVPSNEYLNLVARRQIPYRVVVRSQLSPALLEGFQAILAADLAPPSAPERKTLEDFAEKGGLVVVGPSWGDPPKDDIYAEVPLGKGRMVVYKDEPPEPEIVARDLLDLLESEVVGLTAFNVPSVLTCASVSGSSERALIQLLNYATTPFNSKITLRFNGSYKTARLFTPEKAPLELEVRVLNNSRTEVAVPGLEIWGALLLE
jgi:hypothetical protein